TYGNSWMPGTFAPTAHYTVQAHTEPLPDGTYPKFAPAGGRTAWFPVQPIQRAVEGALGPDPRRVTLSNDERLFAFLPWPAYLGISRGASGSFELWDQRMAEVRRLAATSDPAAFARDSAHTKFGPIDIFVLTKQPDGGWMWRDQRFSRSQFDTTQWTIVDDLPVNVVVTVRR
ncbi:MAG TPA: hypothetical protein VFE14_17505, partial [Micromonosporaceae bacterium]|nr:hypothetical protein [Micromonosporaceae bacterium]